MKSLFAKLLIVFLIFTGTLGVYYYLNIDTDEKKDSTMGEARLPVISTMVEGVESNYMYGYTTSMENSLMRDTITIIPQDHALKLNIYKYNSGILSIGFEVRSLDSKRLIEDTEIESWEAENDKINAVLNINSMIEKNTEYLLIIKLTTEDFTNIYYYTRIIDMKENHYKEQTEFVMNFHRVLFDKDEAESIVSYLEPKGTEDNTNLGVANINSSFSHITWGNLNPKVYMEPVISCKDIIGDVGWYELKYVVRAKNDYDEYQYYNVVEDYRVKWTTSTMYLLDYRRTMNQEFDATTQNISGSRINLGIDSKATVEMLGSTDQSYITFVKERKLWLMDTEENRIARVFAFSEDKDTDLRNRNDNHDIRIVSIDDEGNVRFIVYGYMNKGVHEGSVGVALYSYSVKNNECEELLFIPFAKSYEILKESIGRLAYVSKDVMYIMMSDCIYSIDLKGNEYVQIVSGLKDNRYAINADGDIVAWQTNGNDGGGTRIKVLNLETGKDYSVKVGGKYRIKVLGFVNDDFVYGVASVGDIHKDNNGYVTCLMKKLVVLGEDNNVLKEYSKKGIYFTGAEIADNMINLKQMKKDENGMPVSAPDYQIFGNNEPNNGIAGISTIATDLKKTELVINFVYKITSTNKLKKIQPKKVVFDNTNSMSIRELSENEKFYYVYSYGRIKGVYSSESDAIVMADKVSGMVLDSYGYYVWRKISRQNDFCLNGVSVQASDSADKYMASCVQGMLAYNGVHKNVQKMLSKGKSTLDVINSKLNNRGLDLSGCSLSQVLYYVCEGQPVLGMTSDEKCVLIVGYDFYNAVMVDPATGQSYKYGIEETAEMFEVAGNRFVGIR